MECTGQPKEVVIAALRACKDNPDVAIYNLLPKTEERSYEFMVSGN